MNSWISTEEYKGISYKKHEYTKEMVQMANNDHVIFLPFRTKTQTFNFPRAKTKLFYDFPVLLNRCVNLSYLRFWNFKGKKFRIKFYVQLISMLVDYIAMLVLINKNTIRLKNFTFKQHKERKYAIVVQAKGKKFNKVGLRSRYSKGRKVIDFRFERDVKKARYDINKYKKIVDNHRMKNIFRDGTIYELR